MRQKREKKQKERRVCEWCGGEFERREQEAEHYYCSARCRAAGYGEEHARSDWLMLRVLERAYKVIQENKLNFELEVDMSGYPGRAGMRGEYVQFSQWVKRFAKAEAAASNGKQAEKELADA